MKHGKPWAAASAGVVVAGAVFASAFAASGDRKASDRDGAGEVVVAHGSDRRPSDTASDWVTYADHVVVVTAETERQLPAAPEELEAGQGYLPREVTLKVEDALWSRDGAAKPVPDPRFAWPGVGWVFGESGKRPMAVEGQPRVEVGHTYILAIAWQPAYTVDAETISGQWRGLGGGSVLPYDGGTIGKGESEGEQQTAAAAAQELAAEGPHGPSLERTMTGRGAAELATALKAARPAERQDFGRPG